MKTPDFLVTMATVVVMLAAVVFFSINIGRSIALNDAKYTLSTYTGVGAYVYKHGTIVKVVDGQPVVVGHFDDDSGATYPGTVQIEEAK